VRTFTPTPNDVARKWYVIDAADVVLGRLASHAAAILRGKHKATFAPHMDMGDFVVVINADKVVLTGSKMKEKVAYQHSLYPGGLTARNYELLMEKFPTRAVEKAVKGMLPKNSLGKQMASKLKVYAGPNHPHGAQAPITYEFKQVDQTKLGK
jgi:large subunit ribosomal protein L13